MMSWEDLTHLAGFDWAKDHHDVVILDRSGILVEEFRFDETAEGWRKFSESMKRYAAVGVVIETSSGATVERLLETNCVVYPINPKCAERYRERKCAANVKTDRRDALSMADALRLDGREWKPLRPADPLIVELRHLCRDEVVLIGQRTAIVNQLQAALSEYYPAALEAFEDWTQPSAWDLVLTFPTPQALLKAGTRRWQKFLHVHHLYRPETAEKRMAIFARATEHCGTPPTTAAKSLLAVTLAKTLRTLEVQLVAYRQRIRAVFESHPDHDLFGSLPGAGDKTAPRLLAEIGDDRERFDDAEGLQCLAGTAPVTSATGLRTGKNAKVYMRRACNLHLRYAVHWLANLSRAKSTWAEAYYRKKRDEGDSHARALRALGNHWLKILWKMWKTGKKYDPDFHQRNQLKHGSWVLALVSPAQA